MARGTLWTEPQLSLMRAEYPTTDDLLGLAERIGRPLHSLHNKAWKMHIVRVGGKRYKQSERHAGPWRRRCRCNAIFTTSGVDQLWCEACR